MENSIEHFYDEKSIFITGGTGFMGKVLIEKLLRSCPGLKKIYILIRPSKAKGGKSAEDKLKDVFKLPLFDPLRKSRSDKIFDKVHPVKGDIRDLGLGMSLQDRKLVVDNVSVIFHVAASVRFDDPIHEAIITNTRSTREVVFLAKEMKNIAVLVHVSTTYSNCNRKIVREVIYPAPMNWKEAIAMAENCDPVIADILSKKYLGEYPNTYVFTKNLAEHVLQDECQNIPRVVFRPSIVIPSAEEPFPGWVDNVNGPMGLLIGGSKGVIRVGFTDRNNRPDFMPVDTSIKAMISAAWSKATEKGPTRNSVMVINSSTHYKSISQGELIEVGKKFTNEYPSMDLLWIPGYTFTSNPTCYYFNVMLKQVIPAVIIDAILAIMKKKPKKLLSLQRKVYRATMELSYFTAQEWLFVNMNFMKLQSSVPERDKESFEFTIDNMNEEYYYNAFVGGSKYLLNTDILNVPQAAVVRLQRMKYLRNILRVLFLYFVTRCIYNYFISQEDVRR